jgi:hypothetical protein
MVAGEHSQKIQDEPMDANQMQTSPGGAFDANASSTFHVVSEDFKIGYG